MELFLLLLPAIVLPIGLSIAGIWWLLGNDDEEEDGAYVQDDPDGGMDGMDGGF